MIFLTCSGCAKKLKVQDSRRGKLVQCPGCKTRLRVPDGRTADPDEPAPRARSMAAAPRVTRPESGIAPGKPSSSRGLADRASRREELDDMEPEERDQEPERPRKRRKKRRKNEYSPLPVVLVCLGVATGVYGLLVLWAAFARGGALALLVGGGLLFVCARIWFIYLARQEDVIVYLLVRFVPFYSIYYFFTRIRDTYRPFVLGSVGATFAITGLIAMLLRGDFRSHFERELFDNPAARAGAAQNFVPPPGMPMNPAVAVPAGKRRVVFKKDDQLAATDPKDKVLDESHYKTYSLMLKAGRTYVFDMVGAGFDAFLRLEGPDGQQLAEDDDGGDDLNARILFTPQRDGMYRIVATSADGGLGRFTLTVQELEQGGKGQK